MSLSSRALVLAARRGPNVPEALVRAVTRVAADVTWLRHGSGVRRLEANLARVLPGTSAHELRRLSRAGMRTYLRYFGEALTLPGRTPDQMDARVRVADWADLREHAAVGRSVVLALGHQGNWDLAGAWATRHVGRLVTVAERLEPPEAFEAFVSLREGIGLTVLPLDSGQGVFRELLREITTSPCAVALLADRDLTSSGVEVTIAGHRARVAPGPAALSTATGAPLYFAALRHERLTGERRRAAGGPWGIVVTFTRITAPDDLPRAERVRALTQGWVDVLAADIAEHPTHWHMLQRVFVADLDPARLAAAGGAR